MRIVIEGDGCLPFWLVSKLLFTPWKVLLHTYTISILFQGSNKDIPSNAICLMHLGFTIIVSVKREYWEKSFWRKLVIRKDM